MENSDTHFYKDKPLFGLDIGFSSIKVMQLRANGKQTQVLGYGVGGFDSSALKEGEIVDHAKLAEAVNELFKNNLVGSISSRRVALNIPASKTYARTMQLPNVPDNQLAEAVRLEAAQYIPIPIEDLYLDYSIIKRDEKGVELLSVGSPRRIVDSHMSLALMLGLEPVAFDTSIGAASRLFEHQDENRDIPAVLIDFGSHSTDITIHDRVSIVTGTISFGGDTMTSLISKTLKVTDEEALLIKSKYGLSKSKKQSEILGALKPEIDSLVKEIRRMIRYYEERGGTSEDRKIGQIVTMGGGANTPGINDILTDTLRLPVRMLDPWEGLAMGKLQPPSGSEKSMYMTSAGLALIEPKEIFV